MNRMQIARILTIIVAYLACGNAYCGNQSEAIVSAIEHLLEQDSSDTHVLSQAIVYAGRSNDVIDLEFTLESSRFFSSIYRNVRYKVHSEDVCDMVLLSNSGYILYLCLDKDHNKVIADNSLAKAKKTLYDLEIQPKVKK